MRLLSICLLLLLTASDTASAHELPARVTVHAWVRAEPGQLRVLLRVPLEAMRDVNFPLYGAGFIDFAAADPLLLEAAELWLAPALGVRENDRELGRGRVRAARLSLPTDAAFGSFEGALAHMAAPPLRGIDLPWQQAMLDVLLEYPAASTQSSFSLKPALAHLGLTTTTVLRFVTPDGAVRAYRFVGDPGRVRLDPRWHHAALQFVKLGFLHILGGLDHLLFLLCLVLPVRRLAPLLVVITAFTVAHSITLIAAALGAAPGGLWFPPFIETLIALSIVYMALENIIGARIERRWLVAFAFGLVHGFGFSFLLRDSLQFAGSHLLTSLLAFNIGVELGQFVVIAVAVPALVLLFRRVPERMGGILISALIAHSAWHWMTERAGELRRFPLGLPTFDAALALIVVRTLLVLLVAAAAFRALGLLAARVRGQRMAGRAEPEPSGPGPAVQVSREAWQSHGDVGRN